MPILLSLAALVFLVSGCQTTHSSSQNVMQVRVAQIENRVDESAQQLSDLKGEVKSISDQVEELTAAAGGKVASSLDASDAADSLTSAPATSNDYASIIRVPVSAQRIQTALKNAGYYTGGIDGKLGSGSQKAIRAFQEANGLKGDGIVGQGTWAKLKTYLD